MHSLCLRPTLGPMHLVYLDESGNTGTNLSDAQQPWFVLAALIVPEATWQLLEQELLAALESVFPVREPEFEVHAQQLRNGAGCFRGVDLPTRLALRDQWFEIARRHNVRLVYRAIEKSRFKQWTEATFGSGVQINPHVAAFPLIAVAINEYLASQSPPALGILISDENLEVVRDIEKSLRVLRSTQGILRLDRIIEKGFFVDSRKSLVLQLVDLCAYALRRHVEGPLRQKDLDRVAYENIQPLIHRGNERTMDVIKWLTDERKK